METEAETTSPEVITLKAKDGQGFPVKKGVLIRESGVIADLLSKQLYSYTVFNFNNSRCM